MSSFIHSAAFLLAAVLVRALAFGQQEPERFQHIRGILSDGVGNSTQSLRLDDLRNGKCGLWMSMEAVRQWDWLPHGRRVELASLLSPPGRQKNKIVGHFRIYYDTLGVNTPALLDTNFDPVPGTTEAYIDSVGRIFNETWDIEVGSLGYAPPPLESDGTYHVYVSELGFGYYGLTVIDPEFPINSGGAPRYTTYIEIENDFSSVYPSSRGIPGLEVTAAHEFHHAIQIGSYGTWDSDRFFYEITSTWMEDVVFDDVNDYYQYFSNNPNRSSHFAHPEVRFTAFNGAYEYSRCIFAHFLEHRFNRDLMRRVWENMRSTSSFPAMERALFDAGSTFRQAFVEFAFWNSSTGPNADTARFYPEGKSYPEIAKRRMLTFVPPSRTLQDSVEAVATIYQPLLASGETMLIVVSNIDLPSARTVRSFPWSYEISTSGLTNGKHLSNGLHVRLSVPDPENWQTWESVPTVLDDILVYPQPFVSGSNRTIKFQLPVSVRSSARLTVFSSDMRQLYSGDLPPVISPNGDTRIEWNCRNDNGEALSSGVYVFILSASDIEYKGKIAILQE